MKKFVGTIYQAINIQNRKSYIGKTIQNFEDYKQEHLISALKQEDKDRKVFYRAIRKYGKHNFKWIILGEIESYNLEDLNEKLNEAEIEAIWLFRTYGADGINRDKIYGYNMTIGGDGGDTGLRGNTYDNFYGEVRSKEIREKKSKKLKGKNTGKGRKWTQEAKDRLGSRKGENNPMWGRTHSVKSVEKWRKSNPNIGIGRIHSEETKKKLSDLNKGKILPLDTCLKMALSRVGRDSSNYIEINYAFVIELYFKITSTGKIIKEYDKTFNIKLKSGYSIQRIFEVLNFVRNNVHYKEPREIYLKFVEENKHKIQWYIDNYERLENEYFENKRIQINNEFLLTNNIKKV